MLTIRDLIEQMEIEGEVIVKSVDDNGNETIFFKDDSVQYEDGDFMDQDIRYMYAKRIGYTDYLVIEIADQN